MINTETATWGRRRSSIERHITTPGSPGDHARRRATLTRLTFPKQRGKRMGRSSGERNASGERGELYLFDCAVRPVGRRSDQRLAISRSNNAPTSQSHVQAFAQLSKRQDRAYLVHGHHCVSCLLSPPWRSAGVLTSGHSECETSRSRRAGRCRVDAEDRPLRSPHLSPTSSGIER